MDTTKPVHTLVLDTGVIIKNEPSVSTLLNQCESLVTVPEIISESRDAVTRARLGTILRPFLTLRSPSPASVKFVTEYARKTGDLAVLSKADVQIIALTYEIECERNHGDWRLRRVPGQKGLNRAPPTKVVADVSQASPEAQPTQAWDDPTRHNATTDDAEVFRLPVLPESAEGCDSGDHAKTVHERDVANIESAGPLDDMDALTNDVVRTHLDATHEIDAPVKVDSARNSNSSREDSLSDLDSEGWITPSNLKMRQTQDAGTSTVQAPEPKTMQVAVLTTDFAMQNVILQMNLNLLSPSMGRVKHLKTFVLRCHACFSVTKDTAKQFCPKCGQPTLTRVSCSTNANGEFKLHLKKNMQWNHRGDRYSIPKAVHGSANGKLKAGGKGGWGNELLLAEDQKEYERASRAEKKQKERSLMDEDYLPSILTGDRGRAGGRIKVGAGRNVNSRKR